MANPNPILPPSNVGRIQNNTNKLNIKAEMFKQFYLSPTSHTFCNVYQSGIRAGYSEQYSANITVQKPKWWVELTDSADFKRAKMLQIAEDNLLETVASDSDDREDKKIKHDATKFITERLGKDKYSTRQEVTGADGRRLFNEEKRESATVPLANLFKGVAEQVPQVPK